MCSRRAPTGVRDRALITVMYMTGLRISEALALRVSDIDQDRGTIRVLHGKNLKSRTVGIDDGTIAVIQLWLRERGRLRLDKNGTPLFCTLAGKQLSDRQVRTMIKRRAAKAGIERDVHPHMLRHTFASELSHEGVPVKTIQLALGHSSLATTDIYLDHIAPSEVINTMRSR
jgi:integrase/recombinase XerD